MSRLRPVKCIRCGQRPELSEYYCDEICDDFHLIAYCKAECYYTSIDLSGGSTVKELITKWNNRQENFKDFILNQK